MAITFLDEATRQKYSLFPPMSVTDAPTPMQLTQQVEHRDRRSQPRPDIYEMGLPAASVPTPFELSSAWSAGNLLRPPTVGTAGPQEQAILDQMVPTEMPAMRLTGVSSPPPPMEWQGPPAPAPWQDLYAPDPGGTQLLGPPGEPGLPLSFKSGEAVSPRQFVPEAQHRYLDAQGVPGPAMPDWRRKLRAMAQEKREPKADIPPRLQPTQGPPAPEPPPAPATPAHDPGRAGPALMELERLAMEQPHMRHVYQPYIQQLRANLGITPYREGP